MLSVGEQREMQEVSAMTTRRNPRWTPATGNAPAPSWCRLSPTAANHTMRAGGIVMGRWVTATLAATALFCVSNALHAMVETATVTRVVDGETLVMRIGGSQYTISFSHSHSWSASSRSLRFPREVDGTGAKGWRRACPCRV